MFRKLIDELKINNSFNCENLSISEKIDIVELKEKSVYKIVISDYITGVDYIKKIKPDNKYDILNLLSYSVLWNSDMQMVNKGIYYVINVDNYLYNILLTDKVIVVNERKSEEVDEEIQNKDIILERIITFYTNSCDYDYFSAKHTLNGNTYYSKYYYKDCAYSLGNLDLSKEETYGEISSIIHNLENIDGVENIFDIELLKTYILKDLKKNLYLSKKLDNYS